jgi:hypothetical protein
MTSPDISAMDPRDQALLDQLHDALEEADPVPDTLLGAAKSAYTWLTIDAELAALAEDSLLAGPAVRSAATARSLTFECATGVVVLEVSDDGEEQRRILGQTDRPADLQVLHRGGTLTLSTDEHGRFRVERVMAGPVSVRCAFHDDPGNPIITSWVIV